ncbi:MAG TPA: hypothetical protein VK203_08725 [Nostocaceae cyanobacterium]|nr:hypothetical protein [Nostocaceae cyanobacterium]
MRTAISLLVSSLVFGSLAVNYEAILANLSHFLVVGSGSQLLTASTTKPKPNKPENPTPHRGSGRRELMEYFGNIHSAV